jgi:hypothetical protein
MITYYRLALQDRQIALWTWQTTALTSLQAVFQLLQIYRAVQDRIRVFTAASKEELNAMLIRENNHLASGSVTATQFLQDRKLQEPVQAQNAAEDHALEPEPQVQHITAIATYPPLYDYSLSALEKKRLEIEYGPGGDHNTPYRFTFPLSSQEMLAWIDLYTRVQAGELQP